MLSQATLCVILLLQGNFGTEAALKKQKVLLSDSYLPVAMQVISHLTDQMTYEARDEPVKTTSRPTAKPTAKPQKDPAVGGSWTTSRPGLEQTTKHHKPGLYAPVAPPSPGERQAKPGTFLLPPSQPAPYTVLGPSETKAGETLLSIEDHEIKPLLEPRPDKEPLLPPNFDSPKLRTNEDIYLIDGEEVAEEDLQYLSDDLKELIKMGHDDEDRLVEVKKGDDKLVHPKAKLSQTNLRLMLLYDLLSRDAKKQRLSDYSGFSASVMKELVESSNDGARGQLKFALTKMIDRKDCQHEYANNRAREMITELTRNESVMSNELRYLEPLVYWP